MGSTKTIMALFLLSLANFFHSEAWHQHHQFIVKEASYTRLCESKNILTINGQYPGPTLYAREGDTIYVKVYNHGRDNITLHWHGVTQPRNPWSDGPQYITQCPIQPGNTFVYKIIFSTEIGTLWWHAHSDWSRATVHGVIVVYPNYGTSYPFPKPHQEVPIIFGEWWKEDVNKVLHEFVASGGVPIVSDAYTINGQPGDFYPCSRQDTFKLSVEYGKTYLLRMVNSAMNKIFFVAIANHSLTILGADGSYTKALTKEYIVLAPGQTLDCLLEANQSAMGVYYMAAREYRTTTNIPLTINPTTTAIVQYKANLLKPEGATPHLYSSPKLSTSKTLQLWKTINKGAFITQSDLFENLQQGSQLTTTFPLLPFFPIYNDTSTVFNFLSSLKSLHPLLFPLDKYDTQIYTTISINRSPCVNNSCVGPNGTRLAASMNNISFENPSIDILEAYYYRISGVFGKQFPSVPQSYFNFTSTNLQMIQLTPEKATEVRMIEYNSSVDVVFQATNLVTPFSHPVHLHGFNFYILGWGFGNFDKESDPMNYNLVDPPYRNTVIVPINGWATIRFKATNPGVWLLHCHLERHNTWGMETVFIVKDGNGPQERILPPPQHMPRC